MGTVSIRIGGPKRGYPPAPGDKREGDGCWRCHLCGVRYRPRQRVEPHTNSPECRAMQIAHSYNERGWTQTDFGSVKILRDAKVPVEVAQGAWQRVHDEKKGRTVQKPVEVPFAPLRGVQALRLLSKLRIGAGRRRALCSLLYTDDEFFEAASAVARVNVAGLHAFVCERLKGLTLGDDE